jgi:hypothetical protein
MQRKSHLIHFHIIRLGEVKTTLQFARYSSTVKINRVEESKRQQQQTTTHEEAGMIIEEFYGEEQVSQQQQQEDEVAKDTIDSFTTRTQEKYRYRNKTS